MRGSLPTSVFHKGFGLPHGCLGRETHGLQCTVFLHPTDSE